MKIPSTIAAMTLVAVLAGCVEETPEEVRVDAPGNCPAGRYTTLIGQNTIVLRTLNYEGPIRVIPWGSDADRSYQPDRMTITIGQDDRITSVGCY